ncbi:unnamed protein product [Gadus morhua 'NCC']
MELIQQLLIVTLHLIKFSLAHLQDSTNRSMEEALGPTGLSLQPGPGVCVSGRHTSCCLGWRNVNGACQPVCRKPCIHGTCTRPDTCTCSSGYGGAQCDQDVNECGFPERLCSHRCMNTQGSYRCYCEPGSTLRPDGHTCTEGPGCPSLRCQFGCQGGAGGLMSCMCPPGLRLAANNKTCEDIDECASQADLCTPRRVCRNTFGSYVCVCQDGFVMGTLQGAVLCRDKDECVTGSHGCSRHARCLNTDGSYTCRCGEDYAGDGRTCRLRKASPPPPPPPRHASHAAQYYRYKLRKRTRPLLGSPSGPVG